MLFLDVTRRMAKNVVAGMVERYAELVRWKGVGLSNEDLPELSRSNGQPRERC